MKWKIQKMSSAVGMSFLLLLYFISILVFIIRNATHKYFCTFFSCSHTLHLSLSLVERTSGKMSLNRKMSTIECYTFVRRICAANAGYSFRLRIGHTHTHSAEPILHHEMLRNHNALSDIECPLTHCDDLSRTNVHCKQSIATWSEQTNR